MVHASFWRTSGHPISEKRRSHGGIIQAGRRRGESVDRLHAQQSPAPRIIIAVHDATLSQVAAQNSHRRVLPKPSATVDSSEPIRLHRWIYRHQECAPRASQAEIRCTWSLISCWRRTRCEMVSLQQRGDQ
jgi:hypothetical protein